MQFGKLYAKYYDLLYSDKDYEKECDFIEDIFKTLTSHNVRSIVDVSCGTGGHAIPLAKRGYKVTAFDLSEQMVRIARQKAAGLDIDIRVGDMTEFAPSVEYDCCISMFDSIDYLSDYEDIVKAFGNISKMVKRNGLFIFQYWNGPAVLTIRPSPKRKVVKKDDLTVIRYAEPTLMPMEQTVLVDYHIIAMKGNKVIDDFKEQHKLRFFFPLEIRHLLKTAGFELVKLCPAFDLSRDADETCWSVVAIARKI